MPGPVGLGTLSELAALGKPTIVVPMPNSHQLANAQFFEKAQAVIVLEETMGPIELRRQIERLLADGDLRARLGDRGRALVPRHASDAITQEIVAMIRTP